MDDADAFWKHVPENGATWLKKYVPNASLLGCKVAEILKVCCVGGLIPYTKKFFRNHSDNWSNDSFVEVSLPAHALYGGSESFNKLFFLLHLCNEMNIQCYVSGNSFGYLSFKFRPKNITIFKSRMTREPTGTTADHIECVKSHQKGNGGCEIIDMAIYKKFPPDEVT